MRPPAVARVRQSHSTLCAFYVFNKTEPCDCQGGGPDDPKTAFLRSARRSGTGVPQESEKQFQAAVLQLARVLRWRVYHPWLSVRSQGGWPDAAFLRPPRFFVAEFKRVGKRPTPAQQAWLDDFKACGIEAYFWQPTEHDWEEIKRVLAA